MLKLKHFLCHVSTVTTIVITIKNMLWIPESRFLRPSFLPSALPPMKNDPSLDGDTMFQKNTTNLTSSHNRYHGSSSATVTNSEKLDGQSPVGGITDATIIVTSNFIPTHPSTEIIDRTIESISRYIVLSQSEDRVLGPGTHISDGNSSTSNRTRIPMIITVDGLFGRKSGGENYQRGIVLDEYVQRLRNRYSDHPHYDVLILPQERNIKLIRTMQFALDFVTTKFIYVIQHDLPFIRPVDHRAMVEFFEDRPETVRLIRFGRHATLSRSKDWPSHVGVDCGDELFLSSRNSQHGLNLSMTHTWSDNNHFTTKTYYEEMFRDVPGFIKYFFMEKPMRDMATQNCSRWGTWLYGDIGHGPMITHLDGKRTMNISALM